MAPREGKPGRDLLREEARQQSWASGERSHIKRDRQGRMELGTERFPEVDLSGRDLGEGERPEKTGSGSCELEARSR